jgi:hypothetical protein
VGKRDEIAKFMKDLRYNSVGGVRIFLGNVTAYVIEVGKGSGVESVTAAHA